MRLEKGASYLTPYLASFPASNLIQGSRRPILDSGGKPLSSRTGRVDILVDGFLVLSAPLTADGAFDFGDLPAPEHLAGEVVRITVRAWDSSTGNSYREATSRAQINFDALTNRDTTPPGEKKFTLTQFQSFALKDRVAPADGTFQASNQIKGTPRPILDSTGALLPADHGQVELLWKDTVLRSGPLTAEGLFDFSTVSLSGSAPGDSIVLTLRAWDNTSGATFATATRAALTNIVVGPLGGEDLSAPALDQFQGLKLGLPPPRITKGPYAIAPRDFSEPARFVVEAAGEGLVFSWRWCPVPFSFSRYWFGYGFTTDSVQGVSTLSTPIPPNGNSIGYFQVTVSNSGGSVVSDPITQSLKIPQTIRKTGASTVPFDQDAFLQFDTGHARAVTVTKTSGPASIALVPTNSPAAGSGYVLHPTGTGTVVLHATVAEDETYYGAAANFTLQVTAAPQAIDFKRLRDVVIGEDPMSLSATSSSGLPVRFRVETGPAALTTDGRLQFRSPGTVTIAAEQAGNANYLSAQSVTQSFSVVSAPRNVTIHRESGAFRLTFQGESGRLHAVETVSQLTGAWSPTAEASGSGFSKDTSVPLPETGDAVRFYRVLPKLLPATFGGH
jgi:hypothetical protein